MIIETVDNPVHSVEVKFEDLEPGTVFQFECGAEALKLEKNKYVMLIYSTGDDWFELGDGSMVENREIAKVWGKLVGLKVQL